MSSIVAVSFPRRLDELKIQRIDRANRDFPQQFLNLDEVPEFLFCRGNVDLLKMPMLSAVGSRKLSAESRFWIDTEFVLFLKACRIPVVSGGALGADQAFHRACVRAEIPTVCFLPSGILNPYPDRVHVLLDQIVESGGLVVSQFDPGATVFPWSFHIRNQLIAALGECLFVVEAKQRSGSLMTARIALNLGKEIAVLPHSPGSHFNRGGLDLLHAGARMIRDQFDLADFCDSNRFASLP